MAHFTFMGELPGTDAFGLTFPAGVAVEVSDPHAINKLRGNRFFVESFDGVQVVDAPVVQDAPKRRGRPPKAR